MKIDEFNKYKRIVESTDPELLQGNTEAMKVYSWLESTGRLDEGFWGSIWSWLKRNFSPTSVKLHKLADEFGKEIRKEMKAEFDRREDYKNKAAQMRSSWAGRISGDLEDKMQIIAKEDEDYRGLVKYLINKKTLEAKREMLKYLDDADAKAIGSELRNQERRNEKQGEMEYRNLTKDEKEKVDDSRKYLANEVEKYRKTLNLKFSEKSDMDDFINTLVDYNLKLSRKIKGISLDNKTLSDYLRKIVDTVEEQGQRLRIGNIESDEVMKIILDEIFALIKDTDNIKELSFVLAEAIDNTKLKLKSDTDTHDNKTDDTEKDDTEKDDDIADISKKVDEAIEKYIADNLDEIGNGVNSKVIKFNKAKDDVRTKIMGNLKFVLNNENKLEQISGSGISVLKSSCLTISKLLAPYYKLDDANLYRKMILNEAFKIYAVTTKKITSAEANKIATAIRKDNQNEFK